MLKDSILDGPKMLKPLIFFRCFALARRLVTVARAHKLAARGAKATRAAVPAAVRHR